MSRLNQNITFLVRFCGVSKKQLVEMSRFWFGFGRFQKYNWWFSKERVDVWCRADQNVTLWVWFWDVSKRQFVVLCRMSRVSKEQVDVWRRVDQKVTFFSRF